DRRHDHPRCAEAALERVPLVERALHGVVTAQSFDGGNFPSVGLDGEHGAALHAPGHAGVVGHEHRAGATVAGVAAHHRADLAEVVAQVVDQQGTGGHVVGVTRAVDSD